MSIGVGSLFWSERQFFSGSSDFLLSQKPTFLKFRPQLVGPDTQKDKGLCHPLKLVWFSLAWF